MQVLQKFDVKSLSIRKFNIFFFLLNKLQRQIVLQTKLFFIVEERSKKAVLL